MAQFRFVSPKLRPGLNGQPLQEEIVRVSESFLRLQEARHDADCDTARRFARLDALFSVALAERAFADWHRVRRTVQADTFPAGLPTLGIMRGQGSGGAHRA